MTATTSAGTALDHARVQRRAVPVLVTGQILGGIAVSSGAAVSGLLARQLSGSTALSGLAQTATVLGAALLAIPLARAAGRHGRRPALATGYGLALAGALLILLAAAVGAFPLQLVGSLLFGGGTAAGLQARYAATDAAVPTARGRSLSIVVWATTLGAVAGPNLSGVGGDAGQRLGLTRLAGPYLFSVLAFAAATLVVLALLRPDPLSVRLSPAAGAGSSRRGPTLRQSLHVIGRSPQALLGLTAVAAAHAVMVGVMTMTPVHMVDGGATLQVVGVVISVHIAGMYGASPVFGWLADRVGRVATILLGVGLLGASLIVAGPTDGRPVLTGIGLALLGLGWSASLVGGSTLLSESVPDEVRTAVQGTSDLVMGLAGAGAGALAGVLLAGVGFGGLAASAAVLLLPVVVLAARAAARTRGAESVAGV